MLSLKMSKRSKKFQRRPWLRWLMYLLLSPFILAAWINEQVYRGWRRR